VALRGNKKTWALAFEMASLEDPTTFSLINLNLHPGPYSEKDSNSMKLALVENIRVHFDAVNKVTLMDFFTQRKLGELVKGLCADLVRKAQNTIRQATDLESRPLDSSSMDIATAITEDKLTKDASMEDKSTKDMSTENKSTKSKSTENKSTKGKSTESKSTEDDLDGEDVIEDEQSESLFERNFNGMARRAALLTLRGMVAIAEVAGPLLKKKV